MSTYSFHPARARQDIMSSILNPPSRPPSTWGRLAGLLSIALGRTIDTCDGFVGLLEAAVAFFSPPVKHPAGEQGMLIPGSYDLGTADEDRYSCLCSICARRDGLADRNRSDTLAEAQNDTGTDNSTSPPVSSEVVPLLSTSSRSSGTERAPDVKAHLEVDRAGPPLVSNQHGHSSAYPVVEHDNLVGLALDTVAVATAPFFARRARPASGEYNRQMVANLSESSIRMPKLKPLRLWLKKTATEADEKARTSANSPVAPVVDPVKTTPDSAACMHTADKDTPVGLAMDTIAVAMSPFFNRCPPNESSTHEAVDREQITERIKRHLKALRLGPGTSVSEPRLPRVDPTSQFSSPLPGATGQGVSLPAEFQLVCTPPNEDTVAAPGFSPEGSLERQTRVIPRRYAYLSCADEQEDRDLGSSSPDSPAFASITPSSSISSIASIDMSPFYFDDSVKDDGVAGSDSPPIEESENLLDEIISLYSSSDNDSSDVGSLYSSAENDDSEILPREPQL